MATNAVQDIEQAIVRLSQDELEDLYSWLADYQPQAIDDRIAADLDAGLLDDAVTRAVSDAKSGHSRPL